MKRREFLMAAALLPLTATRAADDSILALEGVESFIVDMRAKHGFAPEDLRDFFSRMKVNKRVIELMDQPVDKSRKTYWREYRRRQLSADKIVQGVKFMRQHKADLLRAEKEYGIPPEITTAIVGIESRYGKVLGGFVTARALSTLAFAYPRRAEEFREQLAEFLIYVRQQNIDPLQLRGSFAGAFGMSQFLPESARRYAVDYDGNGRADLFAPADAIGSIGHFLQQHGWQRGGAIAVPIESIAMPEALVEATRNNDYKPLWTPQQLAAADVVAAAPLADELYLLVDLENRYDTEYRLGAQNFYVITRYNKSFKYASSVFDLSEAIRKKS
ncbi:MAG: lytic murein transglycosylase B [Gammaproteobacteria bacterium WSBS_2016_MAG_OTU1]